MLVAGLAILVGALQGTEEVKAEDSNGDAKELLAKFRH